MNEENILQFRKELQNLGYCKTVTNSYPKQIAKFLKHTRKENFEVQMAVQHVTIILHPAKLKG